MDEEADNEKSCDSTKILWEMREVIKNIVYSYHPNLKSELIRSYVRYQLKIYMQRLKSGGEIHSFLIWSDDGDWNFHVKWKSTSFSKASYIHILPDMDFPFGMRSNLLRHKFKVKG